MAALSFQTLKEEFIPPSFLPYFKLTVSMSSSQFSSTLLTPHVLFNNLEELWSVFLLLTEPPVPAPHLPPTPSLPLLRTFRRSRDGPMGSGDRITTCPWYLLSPIKLRSAKAASSPRRHPALTCSARPPAGQLSGAHSLQFLARLPHTLLHLPRQHGGRVLMSQSVELDLPC